MSKAWELKRQSVEKDNKVKIDLPKGQLDKMKKDLM